MNVLDAPVSFYDHFSDTKAPKTGTFLQIVTSVKLATKYGPLLEKIRATDDKAKRSDLKKQDACFNPSGLFSKRSEEGLLQHSGLMAFDVDPDHNDWLNKETAPILRDKISNLKEVAYCALSASWKGVWGVVPIEKPEHHKEHFEALKADFAGWGIVIDSACSNVSHLRFWSCDPDHYINQNATTYTNLIFPKTYTTRTDAARWGSDRPQDLAQQAVEYLIQNRIPLECTYANFMRIAFACKHEWNEAGKDIALDILHACTTFAQSNTARNFDKLWRNIRRDGGNVVTVGTLVAIAKEQGFRYQSARPQDAPQPPTPHEPLPTPTTSALRDEGGYPAAWDEPTPPKPSRLQEVAKMFEGFNPVFGEVEPITYESENEWAIKHERCRRWYPGAYGIERAAKPAHIIRMEERKRRRA